MEKLHCCTTIFSSKTSIQGVKEILLSIWIFTPKLLSNFRRDLSFILKHCECDRWKYHLCWIEFKKSASYMFSKTRICQNSKSELYLSSVTLSHFFQLNSRNFYLSFLFPLQIENVSKWSFKISRKSLKVSVNFCHENSPIEIDIFWPIPWLYWLYKIKLVLEVKNGIGKR